MNSRYSKKITLTVLCIILLMLCACDKKDKNENSKNVKNENSIYIYYPNEDEVVRDGEVYQIKQPDSIGASIEEVMSVLAPKLNQDVMTYHTYMLGEDNDVELEFLQNGEIDKHYFMLAKAAITSTLFQIKEIRCINVSLTDSVGEVVYDEMFTRESFFFYDSTVEELQQRDIDLYCKSEDGANLNKIPITITLESYTRIEQQVISALVNAGSIPANTTVENATIDSGVCYLELSEGFAENVEGVNADVVVYSVVNSIVAAAKVDAVKIIVNGEADTMYRGIIDLSEPLGFNVEIVK